MSIINGLLRGLFDGLLYPFRDLAPIWGLLPVSLVVSIAMLLIFKATSNQEALDRVKRRIHAGLFEIRLWNDDMRAIFRAQFDILRSNLSYLRHSLPPMLWIIPPLFLVVAQLQFHYGYEGLRPGESTLLEVELAEGAVDGSDKPNVELVLPTGLRAETPAVWSPTERELTWRLAAETPGSYDLDIRLDGVSYSKTVVVADEVVRRSPERVRGWLNELVFPAESPLSGDGRVEAISIEYPDREVNMLGLRTHWLIHFFILTIVFAFLLRKPLGVTI